MKIIRYTRFTVAVVIFYLFISAYAAYHLFRDYGHEDKTPPPSTRPPGPHTFAYQTRPPPQPGPRRDWDFSLYDAHQPDPPDAEEEIRYVVEVWGKAAIGQYLWQHILRAEMVIKMNGVWSYGSKQVNDVLFQYRTGPGVIPQKVPTDVENLVLVLNGREPTKILAAKVWLDYLPQYRMLRRVAVMLLGNEQCDNSWIQPYLAANGGRVQFVFVVYDSPEVDDHTFYQWPLGVATYRKFPYVDISQINTLKKRHFKCNFLATIYPNSSRADLLKVLEKPELYEKCYVKPRKDWWPEETMESQADYIQALLQSDLTLAPVGQNAESYRIYEAMTYGSVPVVEDTQPPGGRCHGPYRLLRNYHAPVIYVHDWSTLPQLVANHSVGNVAVKRRQNVMEWYIYFRRKMKEKFVSVIRERFFGL